MTWLRRLNPFVWWRARQRAMDHAILIPYLSPLSDADFAKAFRIHASLDSAWFAAEWWEYSERDRALIGRVMALPEEGVVTERGGRE